jgi:orotidine-5'-phosphate decarboxylase
MLDHPDPLDRIIWSADVLDEQALMRMLDLMPDLRYVKLDLDTPGIRWPDSDTRDQARVMTPGAAVADGADRVVIGSLLTDSDDPAAELDRIAADIASAA